MGLIKCIQIYVNVDLKSIELVMYMRKRKIKICKRMCTV